jgi:hypothetical protein
VDVQDKDASRQMYIITYQSKEEEKEQVEIKEVETSVAPKI